MELTKVPSRGKIIPVLCDRIDLVVDNVSPGRMIVLFPQCESFLFSREMKKAMRVPFKNI